MNEHRSGPIRSAAAREHILAATAKMFRERGYEQMTIEGVAKEAGVGKQTIYRWWDSRSALIAECLTDGLLFSIDLVAPDTGDLLADLEAWIAGVSSILVAHNGESLLRSLVAAAAEDPEIGDHLTRSIGIDRQLGDRLRIAIRDGQLPADAPIDLIGQAIIGAMIVQSLSRLGDYEESMVNLIRFLLAPRS